MVEIQNSIWASVSKYSILIFHLNCYVNKLSYRLETFLIFCCRNCLNLRCHVPKPTSDEPADLSHTATNFSYAKVHATAACALARDPRVILRLLSREPPANIPINLTLPETVESLSYMFAADSVGLSVFVFTQLFSKAKERSWPTAVATIYTSRPTPRPNMSHCAECVGLCILLVKINCHSLASYGTDFGAEPIYSISVIDSIRMFFPYTGLFCGRGDRIDPYMERTSESNL